LNCSLEEALGQDYDGPYRNFFMHGTSHSLGLDVHDVGVTSPNGEKEGRILEDGMVLTVEPGLYFADWRTDISIPSKYAGIGIRIEDDILITKDGPVILTSSCPKSIIEIESLMNTRS
jgi:Xaa-Pro aminopeptidase